MKSKLLKTSRRDFIKLAGTGMAASALHASTNTVFAEEPKTNPSAKGAPRKIVGKGYNVVLIVTDQERYFREYPHSADLTSRARIRDSGL